MKTKRNVNKMNSSLVGASGEFLVASEISKRGAVATLTLKNTPKIDILATNLKRGTFANIQVKTRSKNNRAGWKLTNKAEEESAIKNHYYVFVNIKEDFELPDFYIIPYNEFAKFITKKHKRWIKTPGKNGQPHKDNNIRNFKPDKVNIPSDKWDVQLGRKYKDKWDTLGIF